MKKLLAVVLALALIFSFAACAAPAATDKSWDNIKEKGSFTLGFDQAFPPMGFKDDNGEFVGFDIDLAKEVASRLGLELKLQPINWDTKSVELSSGNIDVIWNGLTINDDNKKDMLFSDPYMNNRQIIVVAANSDIKSIADLTGKVVAAQVDSSGLKAIEAKPDVQATFAELIQAPDYVEAFMELKQGTIDAVVVDEIFGRYHIAQENAADTYRVLDESMGDEQYGIGFRQGDQAFRDKIQETLTAIINDGKGTEISKKWFGEDILIKG